MSTYWENIYKNKNITSSPSQFALYVADFFKDRGVHSIIELGCGNGRDAYFLSKVAQVTALDLAVKPKDSLNVKFVQTSMDNACGKHDLLYMRFSLHSITEDIEKKVLDFANQNCRYVAIEARSVNDPLSHGMTENEAETTYAKAHYRRYINIDELSERLKERNFSILYSGESNRFAPYKGTKPVCLRIIAQKIS